MDGRGDDRWRAAARLGLLTLLLTPVTILLHELGHFALPLLADLPAQLHPTRVSGGASPGTSAPSWMIATQAGLGPAATVLMSLIAGALFRRDRRQLWALAFAVAAASRFLVTTFYLGLRLVVLALGLPHSGKPNFDEYNLARALGFPSEIAAAIATLFLFGVLFWLMRQVEKGRRLIYFVAMAAGIVAGNIAWAGLAPPVLATLP
jgi:hypothetical protein